MALIVEQDRPEKVMNPLTGKMIKNLIGLKSGRITVVRFANRNELSDKQVGSNKSRHVMYYYVECECGGSRVMSGCNITNSHTQSCGCLHIESISGENNCHFNDLVGKKMGRLTAIKCEKIKQELFIFIIIGCSIKIPFLNNEGIIIYC